MRVYVGTRGKGGGRVVVRRGDVPLGGSLFGPGYRPVSFDWGRASEGAALLALTILRDYLGDTDRAVRLHRAFMEKVILRLPRRRWELTSEQIGGAVLELERTQVE